MRAPRRGARHGSLSKDTIFLRPPKGGRAKSSRICDRSEKLRCAHPSLSFQKPNGKPTTSAEEAKTVWARGGCLGAGSRRRARQAAIVPGEAQTAFDPGVPEWGNPPGVVPRHPRPKSIKPGGATRGTETSKYPEEEKSTEIALVAASERARRPNRHVRYSFRALACRG